MTVPSIKNFLSFLYTSALGCKFSHGLEVFSGVICSSAEIPEVTCSLEICKQNISMYHFEVTCYYSTHSLFRNFLTFLLFYSRLSDHVFSVRVLPPVLEIKAKKRQMLFSRVAPFRIPSPWRSLFSKSGFSNTKDNGSWCH